MILAAGLTPAWQQILLFDSFSAGEVNRAREVHWCASGKVLNVGIALHHLGSNCKTVSFLGGETGQAIAREFQQANISARWIELAKPTRVCTAILDRATATTTELVENSAPATDDQLAAFRAAYAEEAATADVVVLSGSLPENTPATYYRELLECSSSKAILDFRGPELLAALEGRPFLVKPNREELGRTLGRKLKTDADLLTAMRELNARGAQWVVITSGGDSVWMTSRTETFLLQPPRCDIVNPIGCGDSMAAGIARAIANGATVPNAVRVGMAAAAENLAQLLPARLDPNRVQRISETIEVVAL